VNGAALAVLLSSAPALAPGGLPSGWEALSFAKRPATAYEWSAAEGALHARADKSASGLIVRFTRPVAEAPILRWRWKVARTLPDGDEKRKSGDDYAARVYVAFTYDPSRVGAATRLKYGLAKKLKGEYPPHAALNYIWANRLPRGEAVPNAYTSRVMMLAVRSGDAEAGRWHEEERDVLEDYRRLFGEEPPPYAGIAVMTDADDTKGRAEAWFGGITLGAK
jgi:hypothetical protein